MDNRNKRDMRDKRKINSNENYEVKYWKDKWHISSQQLTGAVRATHSTSVRKVENYLKKKGVI